MSLSELNALLGLLKEHRVQVYQTDALKLVLSPSFEGAPGLPKGLDAAFEMKEPSAEDVMFYSAGGVEKEGDED